MRTLSAQSVAAASVAALALLGACARGLGGFDFDETNSSADAETSSLFDARALESSAGPRASNPTVIADVGPSPERDATASLAEAAVETNEPAPVAVQEPGDDGSPDVEESDADTDGSAGPGAPPAPSSSPAPTAAPTPAPTPTAAPTATAAPPPAPTASPPAPAPTTPSSPPGGPGGKPGCVASACTNLCIPYFVQCCKSDNTCGCSLLFPPGPCD